MLYPAAEGGAGLERALDRLRDAGAARRSLAGHTDPDPLGPRRQREAGADSRACWRPPACTITWCAKALRTRCALVVESGDAREVHHVALLIGYGAGAVNPYLAFETLDDMIRQRVIEGVTHEKRGAELHQGRSTRASSR